MGYVCETLHHDRNHDDTDNHENGAERRHDEDFNSPAEPRLPDVGLIVAPCVPGPGLTGHTTCSESWSCAATAARIGSG
jgi:hypothetical protein